MSQSNIPFSRIGSYTSLYVMTRVLRNVLDSEDKYSTDQLVLATTDALPRILACDNSAIDTDRLQ